MAELKVIKSTGKAGGKVNLPDEVFGITPNPVLLHEVVIRHLASLRQGTHKVKDRGEVSGGGRKPWKQKGSGRARQGSIRAPHWRGGGIVQGPQPRSHSWRMPRKKVNLALMMALSQALLDEKLVCVESLEFEAPKTKEFVKVLAAIGASGTTMIVADEVSENLWLSARNVPRLGLVTLDDLTPYDVLVADKVVLLKGAVDLIVEGVNNAA